MPRLWETCTAATNWPKFLKPLASVFNVEKALGPDRPSKPSSFVDNCVLWSRTLPGFLLVITDEEGPECSVPEPFPTSCTPPLPGAPDPPSPEGPAPMVPDRHRQRGHVEHRVALHWSKA